MSYHQKEIEKLKLMNHEASLNAWEQESGLSTMMELYLRYRLTVFYARYRIMAPVHSLTLVGMVIFSSKTVRV